MDERIEMSENDMCNYFIKEQKIMNYGIDFFKDLCKCSILTSNGLMVNDKVLPLSCFNGLDEVLYSVENNLKYTITGGFVCSGKKQSYIRIGINTLSPFLDAGLKRTIRHEIIHYYLWAIDLPYNDDDL